jgi:hypothetical protein
MSLADSFLRRSMAAAAGVGTPVVVDERHLFKALDAVRARTATDIGAPRIPSVKWEDVGGLEEVKAAILDTGTVCLHVHACARVCMRAHVHDDMNARAPKDKKRAQRPISLAGLAIPAPGCTEVGPNTCCNAVCNTHKAGHQRHRHNSGRAGAPLLRQ